MLKINFDLYRFPYLVQLQRHLDELVRVWSTTPHVHVVRIDHLPLLQRQKNQEIHGAINVNLETANDSERCSNWTTWLIRSVR